MRIEVDEAARPHRGARRFMVVAALLALVFALAACGSDSDSGGGSSGGVAKSGTGKPEKTNITFGILPTPDYAPVKIAIDKGYFKDEGLNVKAQIMGPGTAVPGVVGGSYDVAGINWISFLLAVNRNIDLRVVSEADRGVPHYAEFLVKKDSPIQGYKDMIGKKVGVVATPGNCDVIPLDSLKKAGADGKPNFVNVAIPDMPATIQRGGIASACVPEPFASQAKASGDFRSVADLFSGEYEGFPIVGYSTSAKFAEQNPNTIGALRRALQKANALINQDENVVRDVLPTYTKIPAEAAKHITLPTYPEEMDVDKIREIAALMKRIGLVQGDVDVPLATPQGG